MKKEIVVFIFIVVLIALWFYKGEDKMEDNTASEVRGIYVSYIEFQDYFDNKTDEDIKKVIDEMIENMATNKFNLILLHVRPFSDAIYPSFIYPYSYTVSGMEGKVRDLDVLEYFLEKAHQNNIKVHAWINPYRIRNTTDVSKISVENPAFKWIGTNNVKVIPNKGIYYNPASSEVEDLIVNGIQELIKNYAVDGIHFDDYFYPDDTIDLENYQEYLKEGGTLKIEDYRYMITNRLVKRVYDTIKNYNPNLVFGIAPDGNMENNYQTNYADVLTWIQNEGYIDYIMPQIYYGFQNSNKPFMNTLFDWNQKITNEKIKMIPALAFYKIGKEDNYAGSGKEEWINYQNIIKNQVLASRQMSKYGGFSLFRYGSFFQDDSQVLAEKEELLKLY